MRILAWSAVVIAFGAHAADPKSDSVTVLPLTNATVTIGSSDKRASLEFSRTLTESLSLWVKTSAPLDDETRIAAFASENKLVSGFTGQAQFGWDGRARHLFELERQLQLAATAKERLSTLPDSAATGALSGVASDELTRLCAGRACPAEGWSRLTFLCAELWGGRCAQNLEGTAALEAVASEAGAHRCARAVNAGEPVSDVCRAATVLHDAAERELAVVRLQEIIPVSRQALAVVNPELLAELTSDQAFIDRLPEISAALEKFLATSIVSRRDVLLTGAFAPAGFAHAIVGDVAFAYDQRKVYQDDIASSAMTNSQYQLTLGLNYTAYASLAGLSFNARAGYELNQDPKATKFERCASLASTEPGVAGKQCESVFFRTGGVPGPLSSGYARFAVDYQWVDKGTDKLIPGVEVRAGMDGIGASKALNLRVTLFCTPVKGNLAARTGVALDISHALDVPNAPVIVTPVVFIGATLADLMSP